MRPNVKVEFDKAAEELLVSIFKKALKEASRAIQIQVNQDQSSLSQTITFRIEQQPNKD